MYTYLLKVRIQAGVPVINAHIPNQAQPPPVQPPGLNLTNQDKQKLAQQILAELISRYKDKQKPQLDKHDEAYVDEAAEEPSNDIILPNGVHIPMGAKLPQGHKPHDPLKPEAAFVKPTGKPSAFIVPNMIKKTTRTTDNSTTSTTGKTKPQQMLTTAEIIYSSSSIGTSSTVTIMKTLHSSTQASTTTTQTISTTTTQPAITTTQNVSTTVETMREKTSETTPPTSSTSTPITSNATSTTVYSTSISIETTTSAMTKVTQPTSSTVLTTTSTPPPTSSTSIPTTIGNTRSSPLVTTLSAHTTQPPTTHSKRRVIEKTQVIDEDTFDEFEDHVESLKIDQQLALLTSLLNSLVSSTTSREIGYPVILEKNISPVGSHEVSPERTSDFVTTSTSPGTLSTSSALSSHEFNTTTEILPSLETNLTHSSTEITSSSESTSHQVTETSKHTAPDLLSLFDQSHKNHNKDDTSSTTLSNPEFSTITGTHSASVETSKFDSTTQSHEVTASSDAQSLELIQLL
ncbi:cell wall protein DAN4-like [Diaphorina citri]|uniref:Cell wall protein DAN4-like n=1 Tax=Diaphorina citri TaxID=121845 RepID=A0A3Q0JIP4_DIACI|nr:cell wall protein DAN4-like [Diaphorina citri]